MMHTSTPEPPPPSPPSGKPVILQGTNIPLIPDIEPADSTPFIDTIGLDTPMAGRAAPMSPPSETMQAGTPTPSPPSEPVPMPIPTSGKCSTAMSQQVIKFNGYGEFFGLPYHSPHSVLYQDEVYPTALHLFEAHKFLDHRPDLAKRIRECERVEEVTAMSAELAEFTRRDWGNVALFKMDEVLYVKFRQHGDLRSLLLNTYPAELVYVESGDPFWGDGRAGVGMNELGKSLMRVRERLRVEGDMQARTPSPSPSSGPMAMPSPSLGEGTGMPQVIEFSFDKFYGFLDYSPHTVLYQGQLYPTALHLFEARKFLDHRPDLPERIRECQVEDVPSTSAELDEFIRRDWPNVAPSTMDEVLHLKVSQHNNLRSLLLNTYPAELVYDMSRNDPFKREETVVELKELSKSLMRVRERLREEGDMQAGTPTPNPSSEPMPTSQVIKFDVYGMFSGLLYHSPHVVLYQGDPYPTALHLFESRKFLDHRSDIAERIRECERAEEVTAISSELGQFGRRDWGRVALSTMDEIMYLKFGQHNDLCSLLLDTRPAELIYVESGDSFWGDGAGVGLNELGMLLMRVRERLWTEGGMLINPCDKQKCDQRADVCVNM